MSFFEQHIISENEQIHHPLLTEKGIELWIKREDKIHEFVSGNKFRKPKYNIAQAKTLNKKAVLTFGGAYSNHIVAAAVACKMSGLASVGIIRGQELKDKLPQLLNENQTLRIAHQHGMQFEFVSREVYRDKTNDVFITSLKKEFGDFYIVPEGGTNALAIKGCKEVLTAQDDFFDYICTPVGTGGTIAGLIEASKSHQKVIGFPALKGDFLQNEIQKLTFKKNWSLLTDYHFGGYAKFNAGLIKFINAFYKQTAIPLEPIYTGKMLFGLFDKIQKDSFKRGDKILVIHTGGIQAIDGVNQKLRKQGLEEIEL